MRISKRPPARLHAADQHEQALAVGLGAATTRPRQGPVCCFGPSIGRPHTNICVRAACSCLTNDMQNRNPAASVEVFGGKPFTCDSRSSRAQGACHKTASHVSLNLLKIRSPLVLVACGCSDGNSGTLNTTGTAPAALRHSAEWLAPFVQKACERSFSIAVLRAPFCGRRFANVVRSVVNTVGRRALCALCGGVTACQVAPVILLDFD